MPPAAAPTPPIPFAERYFEDYPVGEVAEFGDYPVSEQEVVEFATRYDPQPFHIDAEAARGTIYGGLIASGWMTASCAMRMMVDHYISPLASMGSPGIDELRWLAPVRPGDTLHTEVEVVALRASSSKPDRGVVHLKFRGINQRGEAVLSYIGINMLLRRPG